MGEGFAGSFEVTMRMGLCLYPLVHPTFPYIVVTFAVPCPSIDINRRHTDMRLRSMNQKLHEWFTNNTSGPCAAGSAIQTREYSQIHSELRCTQGGRGQSRIKSKNSPVGASWVWMSEFRLMTSRHTRDICTRAERAPIDDHLSIISLTVGRYWVYRQMHSVPQALVEHLRASYVYYHCTSASIFGHRLKRPRILLFMAVRA
jgi:hypothetical protein